MVIPFFHVNKEGFNMTLVFLAISSIMILVTYLFFAVLIYIVGAMAGIKEGSLKGVTFLLTCAAVFIWVVSTINILNM